MLRNIIQSRCGGRVERCHTIPHLGSYSNASHSWGVAMLMYYLWPDDFSRLAIYCLSHDIPEAWVGDIPAPVMWALPELKKALGAIEEDLAHEVGIPCETDLSPDDFAKLKACDRLELYIWCKEQWMLGNRYVADCMKALEDYFSKNPLPQPAKELYEKIVEHHMMPEQQGVVQRVANGS